MVSRQKPSGSMEFQAPKRRKLNESVGNSFLETEEELDETTPIFPVVDQWSIAMYDRITGIHINNSLEELAREFKERKTKSQFTEK